MSDYDLEIRIIDALTESLEHYADLPRHKTVRYRRPYAVLPEDCPLLCVWLMEKTFTPITTNTFDSAINIGISWQEQAVIEAQTLADNPRKAKELLEIMGRIQQHVRDLSVGDWSRSGGSVDEAYQLYPVRTDYFPPMSIETGLVEGYLMTVRVNAQEDGNLL